MAYSRARKVNIAIGSNIKRIRRKVNPKMSQEDLAKELNLSRVSVVNIERGKQGLTMVTLIDISSALNVPISRILRGV